MVVERRGYRHIESIAFLLSLQPCRDMSDVRVLRSDIPIVARTFKRISNVYRRWGIEPEVDAFICDDANGRV